MSTEQPQSRGRFAVPPDEQKHSGDRRVQRAITLGWQMAQLFHDAVPLGPLEPPPPQDELPGLDQLGAGRRYRLLVRTVAAGYEGLGLAPDPVTPSPSIEAMMAVLDRPDHSADEVRHAALALHVQLFEALTAADSRLGTAYDLGRLLAETTLPADGAAFDGTDHPAQRALLARLFAAERLLTADRWLSALKSDLPDHTAYAVSRSLEVWQAQHHALSDRELERTSAALRAQGGIWRGLLSGEKAALDMLSAGDYADAARAMLARSAQLGLALARTFWWLILVVLVLLGATVTWVTITGQFGSITKAVTNGLAFLVALGVTLKGLSLAAARVAEKVEGPLWQSELDEAVALAATLTPSRAPMARRTGASVGRLEFPSVLMRKP